LKWRNINLVFKLVVRPIAFLIMFVITLVCTYVVIFRNQRIIKQLIIKKVTSTELLTLRHMLAVNVCLFNYDDKPNIYPLSELQFFILSRAYCT